MPYKHISSHFDAELQHLSSKFLEMGGIVESQLNDAIAALNHFDLDLVEKVIATEHRLNEMEIEIDAECCNIIARRQPAASDLRLLVAISKAITNLERAGDEARKVAKRTRRIAQEGADTKINIAEILMSGQLAAAILRHALDAFARLDTSAAAQILRDDEAIDAQYRGFMRKLVTYMAEDPRVISAALDYLAIESAIERIGDHATNLAELVIYIVKGTDVRHMPREQIEQEALRK
ncbi:MULTISPECIES: phosphate signaling complex protein PhoU [unclassified Burkholderia]|uniref:phosphate signaling complex protein PhoU n=1 Tax=unclassified Burkholderia TaxID=2613784 RepID=UPI001E556BA8|nr:MULTISPECIES: phosphate signaling complex protein PhoU [unclassified Burkholderia]UEP31874.1 phosphate signaling complex protein PhoU [Burkholderia sp. B21-007]UEP45538.1 phosphate signaling complex protein PhoU [Burkholderia sp. B21-005]